MSTDRKTSWWKSTFAYTCPSCREGQLFKEPFEWSSPLAMNERCSECNKNFFPEPGYYWGAMFLSYILSGWALLLTCLALVFYFDWSVEAAMLVIIALGAISYIWLMRFSRSLYIHLLMRYKE